MADTEYPVLLLDIDGLKRELFYNMLTDGQLPGFAALFGHGTWVRFAATIFPSETLPAQTSLFTGMHVGRHGIVGNGWLDRTEQPARLVDFSRPDTAALVFGYRLYGLPTVVLPYVDSEGLINRSLYPGVRTIYERAADAGLQSTVVFSHISRGAQQWIRPSRSDVFYYALGTRAHIDYARLDRKTWAIAEKNLLRYGLPDLITLYFCGLDAWGHHTAHKGQDIYLKTVLDPLMLKLPRLFERRGWLDRTRFVLCSDHGHSWLSTQRRISHNILVRTLESRGLKPITHLPLTPSATCYLNVIGGSAQIHIKNHTVDDWRTPPDFESDILPAATALAALGDTPANSEPHAPQRFFSLILVRPSPGAGYFVFRDRALVPIEKFFWDKLDRFPDAFRNIYGLDCPRSGDIVLFTDFERGYYFSDTDVPRSHGSLSRDDLGIPILFSGPGVPRRVLERANIIDVAPTILSFLGAGADGMDGRPLPVLENPQPGGS